MGDNSGIEWLQRFPGVKGASWNVNRGCSEVDEGCEDCYAKNWAAMPSMSGDASKPYHGLVRLEGRQVKWTNEVRFVEHMLDQPLRWKAPRLIFTNSMSDWLHSRFTWEQINRVVEVMARADRHVFMTLTRRTQRLMYLCERIGVSTLPSHIWAGVTIPARKYLFRLDHLRQMPAVTRWLSLEPLLGDLGTLDLTGIHWVVIGGLSGRGKVRPMHSQWVQRIIDQCREQKVPVFFKQWGRTCPVKHLPPGVVWKPGAKTPVVMVDETGAIGIELDKTRNLEMHVVNSNKKANGRHFGGQEFDEYPSDDHFPAAMLAWSAMAREAA